MVAQKGWKPPRWRALRLIYLAYYLTKFFLKLLPCYLVTVMKHPVNVDVFWNVLCDERPKAILVGSLA
jgi:hypothetical protein